MPIPAIKLYKDKLVYLKHMTVELRSAIFLNIIVYSTEENPVLVELNDPLASQIQQDILKSIDRHEKEYQDKVEKNRENGKKGGRPKSIQDAPPVVDSKHGALTAQKDPIEAQEPKQSKVVSMDLKQPTLDYELIETSWNNIAEKYEKFKIPKIAGMGDKRKKAIKARLAEFAGDGDIAFFFKQIELKIEESNHLKGVNDRGWVVNFDFICTASSLLKLLEGNYSNKDIRSEDQLKWDRVRKEVSY